MKSVTQKDFMPVVVAGLLGGAVHAVSDFYFEQFIPGHTAPIEALGMSIKDIALIYLGLYASKNYAKKAWQKQALEGMAVIGIYKTLYPNFLAPTIDSFLGA